MTTVHIVDDDIQTAELLCAAIDNIDLDCRPFTEARKFLDIPVDSNDVILLDLNMPDVDGIEVIRILAKNNCQARLILISGHDKSVLHSAEQLARARSLNVIASFTKPIAIERLQGFLKKIVLNVSQSKNTRPDSDVIPSVEELQRAITLRELILHYQPKIDICTGELTGVEALVRWQHPERGLIYPDLFISLAEENGLIGELTALVISMSMEQNRKWQDNGLTTQISVNVSADNITSLSLPEQLTDMLSDNQLDPQMLTLEVTESALMSELVTSLDILTRLRMKGFGLSIDDFGTGYSSLSQLHKIPFTELKIDQSFVMSMCNDNESRAIVKTCILLGHELNMKVVAEGVETEGVLRMLNTLGCDIAQGYHISRPIPEHELLEWSRTHKLF